MKTDVGNVNIEVQVSMAAQVDFRKAVEKYGLEFAEGVVASEVQLHADNLDCFDEYATYDWMQDLIK